MSTLLNPYRFGGAAAPQEPVITTYKTDVTIPSSSITESLSGFPVYVDLAGMPADFWTNVAKNDGGDIRVVNSNNTFVPMDLVEFDPVNKKGSLWFRSTLYAGQANVYSINYGDSSRSRLAVTHSLGRNEVWKDYERVFLFGHTSANVDRTGKGSMDNFINGRSASMFVRSQESGGVAARDGLAYDGTYYYLTHANSIIKINAALQTIATNNNPCGDVGGTVNKLGDPCVVAGVLYVPMEYYDSSAGIVFNTQRIAKFDATNLTFLGAVDVSAQAHEMSTIAYRDDEDVLYVGSYTDGTKLWKYTKAGAYLGSLSLSKTIPNIEGLTYWQDAWWVNTSTPISGFNAGETIRVEKDGTVNGTVIPNWLGGDFRGLDHSTSGLLVLTDRFGTNGTSNISTYSPIRDVAGGTGAFFPYRWMFSGGVSKPARWTVGASARLVDKSSNRVIVSLDEVGRGDNTHRTTLVFRYASSLMGNWNADNGWLFGTLNPDANTVYRHHVTQDATADRKIYYNGGNVQTQTGVTQKPGGLGDAFYLGAANASGGEVFYGYMSFVYLRASVLSAGWIAAEFANINSPATFYTLGAVAVAGEGGGNAPVVESQTNDPYYPLVRSLQEYENVWTDSKKGVNWALGAGTVNFSTTTKRTGAAAASFLGGMNKSMTAHRRFNLGALDFTLEFSIYLRALPAAGVNNVFFGNLMYAPNRGWRCGLNGTTGLFMDGYTSAGSITSTLVINPVTWVAEVMYDIAISRIGTKVYYFVNQQLHKVQTLSADFAWSDVDIDFSTGTGKFTHGGAPNSSDYTNCVFDRYRFTKGAGRYHDASFPVAPTALYAKAGPAADPALIADAIAIYSTRLARSGYTGPLMRVRRSSDNAEMDIGAKNYWLNTEVLLGFVGAGDGHVVTWYDQSLSKTHLPQITPAYQPMIVRAGALITDANGRPAVENNTSQYMVASDPLVYDGEDLSISFACNGGILGRGWDYHGNGWSFSCNPSSPTNPMSVVLVNNVVAGYAPGAQTGAVGFTNNTYTIQNGTAALDLGNTTFTAYRDGSQILTNSVANRTLRSSTVGLCLGRTTGDGTVITAGKTIEIVVNDYVASAAEAAELHKNLRDAIYSTAQSTLPAEKIYATWSSGDRGGTSSLSSDMLTATANSTSSVRSTVGVSSGKWYFEIQRTAGSYALAGVGLESAKVAGSPAYPGADAKGWSMYFADGQKYTNNGAAAYASAVPLNGIVGVMLDMDAGTLSFSINGVDKGVAFTGLTGKQFAMFGGGSSGASDTVLANFGATPFAYPVPAGYNAGLYKLYTRTVLTTAQSVGGLIFHLDASDASTMTTQVSGPDTCVTSWRDKAGGKDFIQATLANAGLLVTGVFKDAKPYVSFGVGAARRLKTSSLVSFPQLSTVFAVVYWGTRNNQYSSIAVQKGESNTAVQTTAAAPLFLLYTASNGGAVMQMAATNAINYWQNTGLNSIPKGGIGIATFVTKALAADSQVLLNGVTQLKGGATGTIPALMQFDTIGCTDSLYASNGGFAEIGVFDRVLNDNEMLDVLNYLKDKWGTP